MAYSAMSRLISATPPFVSPEKISPLASAIAATEAKCSRCTGATVVTMAICGRAIATRGVISPAWFMPISNTPKRVVEGMRASDNGTPQ
jgi:hypothetical protein